ncbi:MAG: hypothetical protein ACI4DZ_06610 [Oliverpabstia sp.]
MFEREVQHLVGEYIRSILPSGQEETVSLIDYQQEVFRFADKMEYFYKSYTPKILPYDEIDCNGYIAFWDKKVRWEAYFL